jgi:hypothetical protein
MREASIPFVGRRGAVGFWMALTRSMWAVLLVVGFVTALSLVYVQAYARLMACDYQCRALEQEEAQLRTRQRELLAELDAARDVTRVRSRARDLRLVRAPDDKVGQLMLDTEAAVASTTAPRASESAAPEAPARAERRAAAQSTGGTTTWSGSTALPSGL